MHRSSRSWSATTRTGRAGACVALALAAFACARAAAAEDAAEWLQRAANAARQLTYSGTLVYQHAGRAETSRLLHMIDERGEHEKLKIGRAHV